MAAELRFRAMGSDAHLIADGPRGLVDAGRRVIDELEAAWSRFRPTSEVSLMNVMAGRPVRVSPATLLLVRRAIDGARLTDGLYDPTVLGSILRAGYVRSFELLPADAGPGDSDLRSGWRGIEVDVEGSTVRLPEGVGFDPGGIGKGLAADLVVDELLGRGATGVCANLGGDLRVEGVAPEGDDWTVGVEHPWQDEPAAVIVLRSGGVATTSRTRRFLGSPGEGRHHLIDPSSGASANTMIASATAVAARGWQAEVVAKAAFLGGGEDPLRREGVELLLVDDAGQVRTSPGWGRFAADVPARREPSRACRAAAGDLPGRVLRGGLR